jgi:murein DD-endopeptidase MepM/ murein hydrolase activator NlpD
MTLRDGLAEARLTTGHVLISICGGERKRVFGVPTAAFYVSLAIAPLLLLYCLGATLYFVFHDDMVTALMRRQSELQFAYEDRLMGMRLEMDRVVSRQLLDQDSLEGQVHRLVSRQAQLENRAALISQIADSANTAVAPTAHGGSVIAKAHPINLPDKTRADKSQLAEGQENGGLPDNPERPIDKVPEAAAVAGFTLMPLRHDPLFPAEDKPRPEGPDGKRLEAPIGPAAPRAAVDGNEPHLSEAGAAQTIRQQLTQIDISLEQIDGAQMQALSAFNAAAHRSAARLENVFAAAGLAPDTMVASSHKAAPAAGGPFVPLMSADSASPFEQALQRLQSSLAVLGRLATLMAATPVQHPLSAAAEITSGFGGRIDPFNGRTAMHTGVDFHGDYGAPVRATAGGRVSVAALTGGYGKMVEIDHGNGLSTRYAHLSEINVQEGQVVGIGAIVGALGSTGRSTGPHLHYETRIDGEPVDPLRFLRAGARLAASDNP